MLSLTAMKAAALALSLVPVGRFDFTGGESFPLDLAPDGLSGITRVEGNRYLAVSDRHAAIYPLVIEVDAQGGAITSARLEDPTPLRDRTGARITAPLEGPDREGVAYDAATRRVWIADERSAGTRTRSAIEAYDLTTGVLTDFISTVKKSPLAVFQTQTINRGFESIARASDGSETWTGNETALGADAGPEPDSLHARTIRLVRFDGRMVPVAQYPYLLDPPEGVVTFPQVAAAQQGFGLSELLLTPEGALLALERGIVAAPGTVGLAEFAIRIYAVDLAGATDVSRGALLGGLAGHPFRPAGKRRLIELRFPLLTNSNYEGMALGPRLADGSRSLLLIADNDSGTSQSLYALKLVGP